MNTPAARATSSPGVIQQGRDPRAVLVDLGKLEAILPPTEQVPGERYVHGERLRCYVLHVRKGYRGPSVTLSRTHPLALFLDDLQWLDTATLELLERLVTDPDVRHVLLIGAYRDNEVSSSHPLMRTLAAIRDAGARPQEIVLAPLGLDDVERLVTEALHCGPDSAGPLALLVYEKTGGNPFFAIQFLMSLAEEGLLRFDRDSAAWIWDLTRIHAKALLRQRGGSHAGEAAAIAAPDADRSPATRLSRQRGRYGSAESGFWAIPRGDPRCRCGMPSAPG